jgi:hypothetical protein
MTTTLAELGLSAAFDVIRGHLHRPLPIAGRGMKWGQRVKVRNVTCWRPPVMVVEHLFLYILRGKKSEGYPTSGNYSPVCWLMIVVMRWNKASILPAVLSSVRNSIYLSCFYFYTMCNLGEEG